MFGLLKKKLSTFSDKLKQTVSVKTETEGPPEEQKGPAEKEAQKAQEAIIAKEGPKAQEAKEEMPEEREAAKAEEKGGAAGEKKAPQEKTEKELAGPKKGEKEKKKTKEELAEEMEKKLFEDIEKELAEEEKASAPSQEAKGESDEEKGPKDEIGLEAIEEAEKEIAARTEEKATPQKEQGAPQEKKKKGRGILGFVFGKRKDGPAEPQKEEKAEEETRAEPEKAREGAVEAIAGEIKADEEKEETRKAGEKETAGASEEEIEDIEEELEEESSKKDEKRAAEEKQDKRMEEKRKRLESFEIKGAEEDKRELKASVGAGGKLKGMLFGEVEISEKDIADLLDELELSLIESDVEQGAAEEIVKQIKASLVGKKVSPKGLDEYLGGEIKRILAEMMATEQTNVLESARKKAQKPYRILMLGPNGAGKTTSIAKLTKYFQKNGMSCMWAAGDTFRAAAIDQLEEHAKSLGVRVVKQQYGADPAAVAFDAIRAAEAGKIDVVIIDSAGRQETNKNLMEELKKIERVAKPDLKIYVGEAYAGQGLLDQAGEFNDAIGIDGFILTKIDTDAKGGTAISLLYKTKKPILFVGTGQGYDDLKEFSPEFILERII